ncbi:alpha/beta fold hydrolase [Fodinicola acaciae]|uniref:alpha/beta fold hydrolase n=1 Tax=Fodinicola acaciae TaxID=2681555 RepID=UPI0013D274D4|nr:alpha/beta fold hydrolase [Fodinicola acaciae]
MGQHSRRIRRLFAVVLITAAVLVPQETAATTTIDWTPCPTAATLDCGTFTVPLDYRHPGGETISLSLERRKADDQAHKIGTIFVNPGGPGVSGRVEAQNAEARLGKDVIARFDVVGFDPRGVSQSAPLQCFATNQDFQAVLGSFVDYPVTSAEVATDLRDAKAYGAACAGHATSILHHLTTANVARDLDALRQAVGDQKLSYVGYSYGTLLGATYANLFPNRVRALVLDGPIDAEQRTNHRLADLLVHAKGSDHALTAILSACQAAGPKCAFYGGDLTPQQKFDRLWARLRQGPVGSMTISDLSDEMVNAFYYLSKLAPMAAEWQRVYDLAFGTATQKTATQKQAAAGYSYNVTDAYYGTSCVDGPMPADQRIYPPLEDVFDRAAPAFGRAALTNELACPTWPSSDDRPYAGPWDRRTSAPILVIATTHDPDTSYPMAQGLTRELADARLLALNGFGHTSQASACIGRYRTAYLISGALPPAGAQCAQDTPIFP